MTVTISRLYDSYADAQRAVTSLEAAGVPHSDLSIIANNSDNWYGADKRVDRDRDGVDDRAEGAATGAGVGAGLGGAAGLLAGLGLLRSRAWARSSRPDGSHLLRSVRQPVPQRAGVVGALTQAGVSDEEAPLYAEGVRRGGTLVSARRIPDADRARFEAILNQSAVNLRDRSAAWQKAGWRKSLFLSPSLTARGRGAQRAPTLRHRSAVNLVRPA